MKNLLLATALVGLATVIFADENPPPYTFEQASNPSDATVWRFNDWNLNLSPGFSLTQMGGGHLAVALVPKGSKLEETLQKDKRSLLIQPASSEEEPGLALLRAEDDADLEELSGMVHNQPGVLCGGIQVIKESPLGFFSDIEIHPPLLSPRQKVSQVATILSGTTLKNFTANIQRLTAIKTRSSKQPGADEASRLVEEIFKEARQGQEVTSELVQHSFQQPSVVLRIPGSDPNAPIVIMGAHLDSLNTEAYGRTDESEVEAPGADDDASGTAALAEVIRVISENGLRFRRTIEFHGYAAEEAGLRGSGEIAEAYRKENRKVAAMMQFDMLAYGDASDRGVFLVERATSNTLRRSLIDILSAYDIGEPRVVSLPFGSSDHASWNARGYPVAFLFENPQNFNHKLHTPEDTFSRLNNLPMAERYVKLGIAFLAHYAGLEGVSSQGFGVGGVGNDFKLAVLPTAVEDRYFISGATGEAYESLEVCRVENTGDATCASELTRLTLHKAEGERYFFNSPMMTKINSGETWRLVGYESSGEIRVVRHIVIE